MSDSNKKTAIQSAILALLCASSKSAIFFSIALASILAFIMNGQVANTLLYSWLTLLVLLSLVRLIMAKNYIESPANDLSTIQTRLGNFRASIFIAGILWGSTGILMLLPNDPEHQMFLIFLLAGMATAVVVSYSVDLISAVVFSVSVLLPLIIHLFFLGDKFSIEMGGTGILYLGFIVASLFHLNKRILENLSLNFEATERESFIKESNEIHRSIINRAMNGFWLADSDGLLLQVNDAYCRMSGYSEQELLTMHIHDLEAIESEGEVALHRQKVKEKGEDRFESRHRRKDGSTFPIEVNAQYRPIGDGQFVVFLQDITERRKEEAAKLELQNRFQKIASRLRGVVYEFRLRPDGSSCFPYASDAIHQIYRVSPEEVREDASKVFALLHPDDYDDIVASIQVSAKELTPWFQEYRVKFDDGTVRWLYGNALPEKELDGAVLWHGYITDITDRKQIEAEVAESRNMLKTIIDIAPVQVFWKDLDSRYVGCNNAFAIDAGFDSPAGVIGKDDTQFEWAAEAERYRADDVAVMKSGIPKLSYEQSFISPTTGKKMWTRTSKVPLKNQNNETIGLLGIDEDITMQKQIEQELIDSEYRWKYALEGAGDGVWDCNEVARTMHHSKAWKEMLGFSDGEITDSLDEWENRIHPDDKEATLAAAQDCLDGKIPNYIHEYRALCKDGSYKWVLDRGTVVSRSEEGTPLRMIGTITDISERKKVEEALKESEYRWKFAIEGSGDGVWDVNVQTDEAKYSKRWKEMLGYSEDDIMTNRQEWISRIHPDDKQHVLGAGQAYLEGETDAYVVEYRLKCKDGSYKWMLSRGMIVSRSEDGKPLRMIGTQSDISETKKVETRLLQMQAALQESLDRFKDLYEFAPIGYITISSHGLITQLNWRASAMLGLDRKNIVHKRITQFIDESDKGRWSRMFASMKELSEGEELSFDLKFTLHNGMSFLANLNCARMSDQDEQSMLRVTLEDITMIKKSEADLRVAAIAFESHDGLMITDAENKILKVNRAFTKITGYTDEEVVGKSPSMLASGRHDAAFFAEMWGSLNKTGRWTGEVWNRRKSGDVYPENLTITAVKGEKGIITNYVATFTDISMMKAAAEEIQQLAFFDSLTQLPNRRLLMDRLKHAIAAGARSGRQGAVLFLDLDHFKVLNDSLGHDIGDLLLQQVAERLTACVREGDTVARLGGDEYVVVLEDLSEQDLEAAAQTETIANKILASLNQPYQLDAHEHHITPSIGIAVFKNHHSTIEELLKQADIAMYQAKKAGRNTLRFFNPQMQISITARVALERELRKALDNKQLHLYYQIQVDNSGHALGAEALIRWIHPERGLVSPAQFIPLAEETGLILPIGNWVLNTACAQIKAWHKNAHTRDLTLSINVSAKQFRQPDFVAQVRAAIERHSIDPMQLKIELTESLLLENVEDTIASMTALGEIGVQFSLDDFGTGYSSLQYLKRLPLFQLKIDQSFVRDIVTDSHDRSIVRTIIAMAQSLYLNVIAEGVETEQQRELLLSNGCKRYQGYMFGKPVPINEFNAALKQDN